MKPPPHVPLRARLVARATLALAAAWLAVSCVADPSPRRAQLGAQRGSYHLAGDPPYQLDVHLGLREFADERAWAPLEDQLDVGVTVRTPIRTSRVLHFDLGGRYGYDDAESGGDRLEAQTYELDVGLLFALGSPGTLLQPYVGAGLALIYVDTEFERAVATETERNRDSVIGHYLRGGLSVEFRPAQLIGIEVRAVNGDEATTESGFASIEAYTVAITFGARF